MAKRYHPTKTPMILKDTPIWRNLSKVKIISPAGIHGPKPVGPGPSGSVLAVRGNLITGLNLSSKKVYKPVFYFLPKCYFLTFPTCGKRIIRFWMKFVNAFDYPVLILINIRVNPFKYTSI